MFESEPKPTKQMIALKNMLTVALEDIKTVNAERYTLIVIDSYR